MRDAALELAAAGFRVFPLPPRKKQANLPKWPILATTERAQIEQWFPLPDEFFTAEPNVAIATGRGLLVVDLDPRNGSDASVVDLQRQFGAMPPTRTAITPSGGRHYYFAVSPELRVPNSSGKLGKGIDVRCDGGYVVAPPSVTDVGAYRWEVA